MLSIPTEVQAILASGRFSVRYMLRFDLDAGSQGMWSGTYDVTVEGVIYRALAGNIAIEAIPGSLALDADQLQVGLGGLLPDVTSVLSGIAWHQRPAVMSIAFLNDAGEIIFVLPRFSGFLDSITISDAADGLAEIRATIESNNRALSRSTGRTRSDADQRSVSSTDEFFKYATAANTDTQITWGRKGAQYPVR